MVQEERGCLKDVWREGNSKNNNATWAEMNCTSVFYHYRCATTHCNL